MLRYLHETYGNSVYISIMNQFTPLEGLEKYPELNRRVTEEEYEEVVDYAISLGIERALFRRGRRRLRALFRHLTGREYFLTEESEAGTGE